MYIPIPIPYPIEKVKNFTYPYPVNVEIPRQNEDEFRQYSQGRVYFPSLCIFIEHLGWLEKKKPLLLNPSNSGWPRFRLFRLNLILIDLTKPGLNPIRLEVGSCGFSLKWTYVSHK